MIKTVLPTCKTPADLRFALKEYGIEIEYKYKRTANEIEGVSFRDDNIKFKGSEVNRKYSFGNLKRSLIRISNKQNARQGGIFTETGRAKSQTGSGTK